MNKATRKVLHSVIGVIFIILGVFGLVLPIINGTILLIIGLIILSFENPALREKLFRLTQKNKTIHALFLKLEKFLRNFFRK